MVAATFATYRKLSRTGQPCAPAWRSWAHRPFSGDSAKRDKRPAVRFSQFGVTAYPVERLFRLGATALRAAPVSQFTELYAGLMAEA
jgi:hypothetical protein